MASLLWAALIVFLVGLVAGVTFAAVRGLAAYRVIRVFLGRFGAVSAEMQRSVDGVAPRLDKATATAERLEEARARLDESLASARVLFAAFGEALALVQRVKAFVPR